MADQARTDQMRQLSERLLQVLRDTGTVSAHQLVEEASKQSLADVATLEVAMSFLINHKKVRPNRDFKLELTSGVHEAA